MSNTPIGDVDMPDPWMLAANGQFYLTFTLGNRVGIWASDTMENFSNCRKSKIWEPRDSGWGGGIWAPELHQINDKWYVYFAAERPGKGNASHRTLILRSDNPDPMHAASWVFVGPLKGVPDHWAIDATVFSPKPNELYCCYSGWPLGDNSDTQQDLFLVRLASPEVAVRDSLVCISRASLPWERPDGGRRGVNEGPTWVNIPGFSGIVFSANGSWTCDYKLGIVRLVGDDLLLEKSWQKRNAPLLVSDRARGGPFGPGHASFVRSPHGFGTVYCVYHGTERPDEGWRNRKARIIMMSPEHFHPQAQPLCCAKRGPPSSGMHGQPGFPGGPSDSSGHRGLLDKVGDRLMQKLKDL